jgi:hypothetical protein
MDNNNQEFFAFKKELEDCQRTESFLLKLLKSKDEEINKINFLIEKLLLDNLLSLKKETIISFTLSPTKNAKELFKDLKIPCFIIQLSYQILLS